MKKKMNDILDGITPEELDAFREALTEEPAPADIDEARIASLVAQKTGLDCAGAAAGKDAAAKDAKPEKAAIILPSPAQNRAAEAEMAGKKGRFAKKRRLKVLVPVAAVLCVAAMLFAFLPALFRDNTKCGTPADPSSGTFLDGVIGERQDASDAEKYGETVEGLDEAGAEKRTGDTGKGLPEAVAPKDYSYSEAAEGGKSMDIYLPEAADVRASVLTAKEYRDLDYIADWKLQLNANGWYSLVEARDIRANNIVEVRVTHEGKPVYNAKAELLGAQNVLFTALTDAQGRAYLFWGITSAEKETPTGVRVGEKTYDIPADGVVNVEAESAGLSVTELDLMLMIDTTGSMGDELAYLQAELEDTVKRVASGNPNLSIRVSVNFYRDEGDAYVVKYYDFRTDIKQCLDQMKAERAAGGGDTPEAVHTALENAVTGHNWRENAVKLCFFVLDAAPHSENERQGVNESLRKSLVKAAELGVRIIPVVSSGADADCEYVMRTAAVMTGGTYVYLTDESGIGGGHKQAEIDKEKEKETEYLNDCMVRLICEYCNVKYVAGQ